MSLRAHVFHPLRSHCVELCSALANQLLNALGVLRKPDALIPGHLGDGEIDWLVLLQHSVGCNHHPCAILAGAAMNVYWLWPASCNCNELRNMAIEKTWR